MSWNWIRPASLIHSPLPRRFRDRQSQLPAWRQIAGDQHLEKVDALLTALCDAFCFSPDERYQFGPHDTIAEIYRSRYPAWKFWKIGDGMEIETLMLDLQSDLQLNDLDLTAMTLGEIASHVRAVQ